VGHAAVIGHRDLAVHDDLAPDAGKYGVEGFAKWCGAVEAVAAD
jgi:hypothetical protein